MVEKFKAKYRARKLKKYDSSFDVAVLVQNGV